MAGRSVWNRSGRRSGGTRPRRFFSGAGAGEAPLDLWLASVNQFVRKSLGKDATEIVSRADLVRWYEAGERNTWAAARVIELSKGTP